MKQKKNKIMFIFMLFIMLFFIVINNNVFASSVSVPEEIFTKLETINHGDNYVILYNSTNNEFYVVYQNSISDSSTYANKNWTYRNFKGSYFGLASPEYNTIRQLTYKDGSFTDSIIPAVLANNYQYACNYKDILNNPVVYEVIYACQDILYSGVEGYEDGTVFFQAPVQEQGLTILTLETAGQIPETMGKVLKVIIPVGLIILSMVLVISLVKSVILRAR